MTERHQALAGRHESRNRLLQICERQSLFRNKKSRSGGAKRDAVMQVRRNDGCAGDVIYQFSESAAEFQARLTRLAGGFSRAQFIAQAARIISSPCTAHKDRFQRSGLFEVIPQKLLDVSRVKAAFVSQGFQSERMRRRTDR